MFADDTNISWAINEFVVMILSVGSQSSRVTMLDVPILDVGNLVFKLEAGHNNTQARKHADIGLIHV